MKPHLYARMARMIPDWVARSFLVSAVVGVSYLLLMEVVQWLIGYSDAYTHSVIAFVLYVVGIYANYLGQKHFAFSATNSPIARFYIYNVVSAGFVSLLSGWLYTNPMLGNIFGSFIEAASTALALLLVSPVTFIFFNKIFKS